MLNGTALEGTLNSTTVIDMGPPCGSVDSSVRRKAGTVAESWLLLTKVVGKSMPFQSTTAPCWKLEPLTVSVKLGLPSGTVFEPVRLALTPERAGGGPASPISTKRDSSDSNKGRKVLRDCCRRLA